MPAPGSERPPLSVWLRPERPPRDRRLGRDRIVRCAVGILDAEGHRGLSMRRVATELGVTAGSLYWYVATKDELLELARDEVLAEVLDGVPAGSAAAAGPGGGAWRGPVGDLARGHRAMLLRHPWVLADLAGHPGLGPNALALAEFGLTALARAGFGDADLETALGAVNDQVVGAVVAETAWRAARDRAGDRMAEAAEHLRRLEDDHPLLAHRMAAAAAGAGADVERESERRFAFALDCLLDGLAARRRAE